MAAKIIKTGNSAAVTLPANFVKALNLKVGDPIKVKIDHIKGEITFQFPGARQLPLTASKKEDMRDSVNTSQST